MLMLMVSIMLMVSMGGVVMVMVMVMSIIVGIMAVGAPNFTAVYNALVIAKMVFMMFIMASQRLLMAFMGNRGMFIMLFMVM